MEKNAARWDRKVVVLEVKQVRGWLQPQALALATEAGRYLERFVHIYVQRRLGIDDGQVEKLGVEAHHTPGPAGVAGSIWVPCCEEA